MMNVSEHLFSDAKQIAEQIVTKLTNFITKNHGLRENDLYSYFGYVGMFI